MPEHNPGQMGGTMRLGKRRTIFMTEDSVLRKLYGDGDSVEERHRHRYEVNPDYVPKFEAAGMRFVGQDEKHVRMEILELTGHPFYAAVQYHPEYISRPMRPSPPYLGLILAATGKLRPFLSRGCRQAASSGQVSPANQQPVNGGGESDDSADDEEIADMVRNIGFPAERKSSGEQKPSRLSAASAAGAVLSTSSASKKKAVTLSPSGSSEEELHTN